MDIKKSIVSFGQKAFHSLKKYSPEIATGGAILFGIGTVVCTWVAARKYDKALEEPKKIIATAKAQPITETYTVKDRRHDIFLGYRKGALEFIKLFGPAALMGGSTIACILGSHRILSNRNAGLAAVNSVLAKQLKDSEDYVANKFGKEELEKMRLANATETKTETVTDENGEEKTVEKTVAKDGYEQRTFYRLFDECNPNWVKDGQCNYTFILSALTHVNDRLHARSTKHITLNEVYEEFGIPRTQAGYEYGWICDPNDPYSTWVDIGYDLKNRDDPAIHALIKHNMGILLQFNCEKMIWTKLPLEEA